MAVSSKLHILILDPTKEMRTFTKDVLKRMGLKNIQVIGSTTDALKEISEHIELEDPYELVILDYEIPEMNGVEFYKKVVAESGDKCPGFILTMSTAQPEAIKDAVSNGIKHVLVKPYNQQQLVEKLIKLFDSPKKKAA